MKRGIRTVVIAVALIAVVTATAVALYLDVIAKRGIETGSKLALGVDTSVDKVNLGLVSGNFGLSDFHVRNPDGFESEDFFVLQRGRLSVGLRSVLADTVVMKELVLDGVQINLELVNGKSNYGPVLDHLKQFEKREATEKKSTKRFIIEQVTVKNVVAQVRMRSSELGIDREMKVDVPELRLERVGSKKGGIGLPEMTSIVVTRLLDAVIRSGGDLPAQLKSALRKDVAYLVSQHRSLLGDVKMSGRQTKDKVVKDVIDETKDKLKGLLGD